MPVTRASGIQNYKTDGSNYIPDVYAKKLIRKFYAKSVFPSICNTDYEGLIKAQGDTVKIPQRGNVVISDYEIGGGLGTAQRPSKAGVTLNIDQAKYYNIGISSVDQTQSHIGLKDENEDDAVKNMAIAIDTDILANVYTDVASSNSGTAAGLISGDIDLGEAAGAIVLTKDNIVEYVMNHMLVLDEANVDEDGRWIVLPKWACMRIKLSDLKDASITGDAVTPLRNGLTGKIDRCEIYASNLLDVSSGEFNVIAGHPTGMTFASQLVENRIIPDQNDFQDLLQGLQVYGYKVTNDVAVTHGVIKKAA